jgi:hypothetical protein
MPVILALGWVRQEDYKFKACWDTYSKFKISLVTVRLCLKKGKKERERKKEKKEKERKKEKKRKTR